MCKVCGHTAIQNEPANNIKKNCITSVRGYVCLFKLGLCVFAAEASVATESTSSKRGSPQYVCGVGDRGHHMMCATRRPHHHVSWPLSLRPHSTMGWSWLCKYSEPIQMMNDDDGKNTRSRRRKGLCMTEDCRESTTCGELATYSAVMGLSRLTAVSFAILCI